MRFDGPLRNNQRGGDRAVGQPASKPSNYMLLVPFVWVKSADDILASIASTPTASLEHRSLVNPGETSQLVNYSTRVRGCIGVAVEQSIVRPSNRPSDARWA